MHGRHHTGWVRMVTRGVVLATRGAVADSLVGPNIAITLMPIAAARCIAPESLVTSVRQFASTPASAARSVAPTRLPTGGLELGRISAAAAASAGAPIITLCTPSAARPSTSSAKYDAGQRFAPP